MSFLQRLLGRSTDRRPIDRRQVIRISRHNFRKPWWRRSSRVWLMLLLLLALLGVIGLLIGPAQAFESMIGAASDETPLSP